MSLQVGADDSAMLDQIIDSLTSLANPRSKEGILKERELSLKIGKISAYSTEDSMPRKEQAVLILGAGRVCRPAAEFLTSKENSYCGGLNGCDVGGFHVIVASLYQKDAEEVINL